MQRKVQDHKDHDDLRGCFYRGRVRSDDRSRVTVSLCDGMVSKINVHILTALLNSSIRNHQYSFIMMNF